MSVERRDPAVCNASDNMESKGEMIKAPISLQDLRRRIYRKAKTEPAWRFWGLYVHVCKLEVLREAYRLGAWYEEPFEKLEFFIIGTAVMFCWFIASVV